MTNHLYSVTLTDLGTYTVTVAAHSPDEAKQLAKTVLYEEVPRLPTGVTIVKRETECAGVSEAAVPVRMFTVDGVYKVGFELVVPAASAAEAELHARRLYEHHCGPYEFATDGGSLSRLTATEVVS